MKKTILAVLLFVPTFALADVRINEVAWMGMSADLSNDEWVELYNDGDTPQDVTGWTLSPFKITKPSNGKLSGTIASHGYYLFERTDDTSVPDPIKADAIYTGAMVDDGAVLALNDLNGKVDSVDFSVEGTETKCWPAGNNSTKETMQWNDGKWITAIRTPKAENSTIDTGNGGNCKKATVTPGSDADTNTVTNDITTTTTSSSVLDTSAHVSPMPLSDFSQKQELYISAGRNRIVSSGSPVVFEAFAIDGRGIKNSGISANWSFGDGGQAGGIKASHSYKYPGDYVVVLNASAGGNEAVSRAEVRVFAPKVLLSLEQDGAVSLANDSEYEINVGGWKILSVAGTFSVAQDTIIKGGKKIMFPKSITVVDFSASESVELLSSDNSPVVTFIKAQRPAIAVSSVINTEIPPTENVIEKEITSETSPAPVAQKTKQQMAVSLFALSGKVKPEAKENPEETLPVKKITIKKPESWFEKMWNFLF